MQRAFEVLLFLFVCAFCPLAFSQETAMVWCDPDMTKVPALTAPGSAYVIEQLSCGQTVSLGAFKEGYFEVQLDGRIGYVNAKYVRFPEGQEQRLAKPGTKPEIRRKGSSDRGDQRRHRGGLAFEVSNIYYDEPGLMRNKGFMYGLSGDYTFQPNNFRFKADGRFSLGNVDYWSNGTGTAEGLRDYNFETRFSVGYDLKTPSRKAVFTPFMGFGYRYLFDGESAVRTSTGHLDYDRKQHYLYSPVGMDTVFRLGGRWSLGLCGEYDLFWHGWNQSEVNEVGSLVPLKFDQKDGWGTRGSARIIRNFGKIDFIVEPYFRYWDIDQSDVNFLMNVVYILGSPVFIGVPAVEPHNTTTEWGLKLGFRF